MGHKRKGKRGRLKIVLRLSEDHTKFNAPLSIAKNPYLYPYETKTIAELISMIKDSGIFNKNLVSEREIDELLINRRPLELLCLANRVFYNMDHPL